jgi:hypothetical protein
MAREAGVFTEDGYCTTVTVEVAERFAALISEHEREALLAVQKQEPAAKIVPGTRKASEPPKQEPVGYWNGEFSKDGGAVLYEMPQNEVFMVHPNIPLYTAPPNLQKAAALELASKLAEAKRRESLPIQSPIALSESEFRLFALGWMECEAAHGMVE